MIPNKQEHSIAVIYLILCKVNGKIYVGSAANFFRRYMEYAKFRQGKQNIRPIESAIKKHGFEQFEFSVLERVDDVNRLIEREQYYLDLLQPFATTDKGYNVCVTAGSRLGMKHSIESREKMSRSLMGRVMSEETRKKISATSTGKKMSKESIERSALGRRVHIPRMIERMSRAVLKIDPLTMRVVEEYPSVKIAAQTSGVTASTISLACWGHTITAANCYWCLKSKYDPITFAPRSSQRTGQPWASIKPINQMSEDGNIIRQWSSATEAAKSLNGNTASIRKCCLGQRKRAYGYRWSDITDADVIESFKTKVKEANSYS